MDLVQHLSRRARRVPRRILKKWIVDQFHCLWYESLLTWRKNSFLGFTVKQLPMDLWLYQELLYELRPDFVLQTGVSEGGSILFFAHLLDLIGAPASARVVGVDIVLTDSARRLSHPRITLIESDSTAPEIVDRISALIKPGPGLVVLDSDHREAHVARELELYAAFVQPGSYLVVEDTNVNGHPVDLAFGPGPHEAVTAFLEKNPGFERDDTRWKRNLFSFHQHGWLKRRR